MTIGRMLRAAAAVALAGALGAASGDDARAQDVTLEFVVWNYSLETIQDNVAKFEADNPGIKVNVTDYTWPDYHDTMVLRLRGNTQTDVIYAGQDWLPSWASAGWLVPLEEYYPEVTQYEDRTTDYALSDMTYNDQLYGLSYYADIISFVYNKEILDEHGIEVPQTWDDVLAASLKLKEARHGEADRLRVQSGAAELLRRLRRPGLRPRRRHVRRRPQPAVRRSGIGGLQAAAMAAGRLHQARDRGAGDPRIRRSSRR